MIIDPIAANIAAMRWLNPRPLTIPQIAELLGRSKSTVDGHLRAVRTRLLLLDRVPPPEPLTTYVPAREAGLSKAAASFAFWFGYTLSPKRAAELSGHGRTGPTSMWRSIMSRLAAVGTRDARLREWVAELLAIESKLESIRTFTQATTGATRLASTTLGKRRNGLQPDAKVVPIPWLDEVEDDIVEPGDFQIDLVALEQKALHLHRRLGGDPVRRLTSALETDPAGAIDVAFELAGRDLPYFDAFRDRRHVRRRSRRAHGRTPARSIL